MKVVSDLIFIFAIASYFMSPVSNRQFENNYVPFNVSLKDSSIKFRCQFYFFVGFERGIERNCSIGYIDQKGRQQKIELNRKGKSIIIINTDSISFFYSNEKIRVETDMIYSRFLKNDGIVTYGVIPNYDSAKGAFDKDLDLQLKIMNESETVYAMLSRDAVVEKFRKQTISKRKSLVYISVKQKSFSTGGIYYKYEFFD